LRQIYLGKENVKVIDETWSNRQIRETIGSAPKDEVIMMLGHGYEGGLLAPWGDKQFGRTIVDERLVYLLREHTCVGIWCYANEFAEKHNLKGLFTGMVVSDANEAIENCLDFEGEDIGLLNEQYASDMEYCLRNYPLARVPKIMKEVQDYASPIKDFNYSSLHYYE